MDVWTGGRVDWWTDGLSRLTGGLTGGQIDKLTVDCRCELNWQTLVIARSYRVLTRPCLTTQITGLVDSLNSRNIIRKSLVSPVGGTLDAHS